MRGGSPEPDREWRSKRTGLIKVMTCRVMALALVLPLLLAFAAETDITATGVSKQTSKQAKHATKAKHAGGAQHKRGMPPPAPPSAPPPSVPVQWGLPIWLGLSTLAPPITLGACVALRESGWRWPSSSSSQRPSSAGVNHSVELKPSDNASWGFVGFLIVAYFVLNIGLSILNRWALGLCMRQSIPCGRAHHPSPLSRVVFGAQMDSNFPC